MSLKNIFKHKPNRFVELLIEQATLTERGLEELNNYLLQRNSKNAKKINHTEKEADEVRRVLIEELMKTFVTPYDREDIFSLSREIDDVLDYVGPDGKEPGQDVKEGIVTMPVIMLSCKEGIFTDPFLKTLEKVSTENTLHKTISLAKDYSNRANASLKPVVGENMDGIELLSQINEDIYERLPSNLLQESKKHQWQTL